MFNWCKNNVPTIKLMVFVTSIIPISLLVWKIGSKRLGPNPLDHLLGSTGIWAFNFLLLTLAVSPSRKLGVNLMRRSGIKAGRRLSDWNFLIKIRRMLGLFCFFYSTLHLSIYLSLDAGFDIHFLWDDILEKSYIKMGWFGYIILFLLAITSSNFAIRKLGKNWRRLHRFIYLSAILAAFHYLWLVKVGNFDPVWYIGCVIFLLSYRMFTLTGMGGLTDTGMEVAERPNPSHQFANNNTQKRD